MTTAADALSARIDGEEKHHRDTETRLTREAQLLTRYLLDRDCPDEMVKRYVAGNLALRSSATSAADAELASFAFRHPRSLPFIDAAAAISGGGRGALLRSKLQLITAILEASPRFAAEFLPPPLPLSRPRALLSLSGYVAASALKAVIGVPLLLVIGARAR